MAGGGRERDVTGNLWVVCIPCNLSKSNRPLDTLVALSTGLCVQEWAVERNRDLLNPETLDVVERALRKQQELERMATQSEVCCIFHACELALSW